MWDRDRTAEDVGPNPDYKDTNETMGSILEAQREHAKRNQGRTSTEGGEDYKASEVERLAGTIRLAHYEVELVNASNSGDQDTIDSVTNDYHEARLKVAQDRIDKCDQEKEKD